MKTIDIDWTQLLDFTAAWDELDHAQRKLAMRLGGNEVADASSFGDQLDALVAAGMLERFKEDRRVRPAAAFRPALKVLRLMDRVRLFQLPGPVTFDDYLKEILTTDERAALVGQDRWSFQRILPAVLASRDHLDEFLECEDVAAWELCRLPDDGFRKKRDSTRPLLDRPETARDLRKLVRALMACPTPIACRELPGAVGRMSRRRLADAILAGLRYALCYAGFDGNMRPALSLQPALHARLHRETPPLPETVEPDESCRVAWGMEDMLQLLVFCSEPRRLRSNDRRLFAKAERELEALLAPVPDWIMREDGGALRIRNARSHAEERDFVRVEGEGGRTLRLQSTEAGRAWLTLPPNERTRTFLGTLREEWRDLESAEQSLEFPGLEDDWLDPDEEPDDPGAEGDFPTLIAAAFEPLTGPVLLQSFLRHRAECANPLMRPGHVDLFGIAQGPLTDEALEEAWQVLLLECLQETLAPHGGAYLGRLGKEFTLELTDVGRYILGLSDELALPHAPESASIVVQPDFEIVFLAPNPALEASFTRFAERIGQGIGALFRLTRPSIQVAARAGLTRDEILSSLADASEAPLPPNVAREIDGWFEQCVRLAWEPAQLLRCPDEETAARVLAAARGKLELVSPTVLALTDIKQRTPITNTCRKAGVFIDLPDEPPPKKRKTPKRRRGWRW